MNGELQNANPTILNASELPTRRRTKRKTAESHGRGDDVTLFKPDREWHSSLGQEDGFFGSEDELDGQDRQVDDDQEAEQEDPIDEQEIFDLISTISDPEHPLTLGQLAVVNLEDIHLYPPPTPGKGPDLDVVSTVTVELTPTVNHCSLATIIGLAVRVRLDACLPPNYRIDIRMKEGSHAQDSQIDKQLADKERIAAALENDTLKRTLDTMMETCIKIYDSDDDDE